MEFSIELILSILITAIIYLLVPVIVILTGKKLKKKAIITITIVNCVVFWFVFRIIEIELYGESGSGAAVFLWGAIGYWLMKRNCLSAKQDTHSPASHIPTSSNHTPPAPTSYSLSELNETPKRYGSFYVPASELAYVPPENNATATPPAPSPKVSTPPPAPPTPKKSSKYCSICGNRIDPVTKKCTGCGKQYFKGIPWRTVVVVILVILLVASVAGNVYLYTKNANLIDVNTAYIKLYEDSKRELSNLENKITKLEIELDSYASMSEKLQFFDTSVVFIEDDGSDLYHTYDCYKFVGNSYWAHNIEYAEYLGYAPCPLCFD